MRKEIKFIEPNSGKKKTYAQSGLRRNICQSSSLSCGGGYPGQNPEYQNETGTYRLYHNHIWMSSLQRNGNPLSLSKPKGLLCTYRKKYSNFSVSVSVELQWLEGTSPAHKNVCSWFITTYTDSCWKGISLWLTKHPFRYYRNWIFQTEKLR